MDKDETLILFDVGGVLLRLSYDDFYTAAAERSGYLTPREFKRLYIKSNLEKDSLVGKKEIPEYLGELGRIISPDNGLPEDELRRIVNLCWKEQVEETVRLKRQLHEAGYPVGISSNISSLALEILSQRFPEMMETFNPSSPVILSFEVGDVKPNPQMYERIAGYERVIFIDDKEGYLRTGIEKFGWFGIHFKPHIDPAEAIRAEHNDTTRPSKNFRAASSYMELVGALRHFGVDI